MPPMAFIGVVTKVGFMNKTATVTVSRNVLHKITGKVRTVIPPVIFCLFRACIQRIERRKKFLAHDEHNRVFLAFFFLHFRHEVNGSTELRLDDTVVIRNCPPISARKRFKLEKVLKSPEKERDLSRTQKEQASTEDAATLQSPSVEQEPCTS
jgi:small subunit ribosomal protein S17